MVYERDEDGEPIYDPDNLSEDAAEEEWQQPPVEDEAWQQDDQQEAHSPASAHGSDAEEASKSSKPRKRLVKKSATQESGKRRVDDDRRDTKEERRRALEKSSRMAKQERTGKRGKETDMNEMWNSVAGGGDSEDDHEGERNNDDMAFIDDTGVEGAAHYVGSDGEAASAGDAPQAEEGEEDEDDFKKIFKSGKKRKQAMQSDDEIIAIVEHFIAKMATAAEDDADLNRRSKPAINKLKLLPTLVNVLQKRQYQSEFLDRGVLSWLKNWLEPLPDGSLPNMNIRTAILKLLSDLPIDLEHGDRREQLKNSGLGKVVMFLSKLDEETYANKKLAKDLVDKWSRPLFQKSTRYEYLRGYDEERPPVPRKAPATKKRVITNSLDDDLMEDESDELKPGQPGYRNHASRPEAIAMDFVVRPQSKVDMEEVLNSRKQQQKSESKRAKMNKKLQQLRTPKKRKLQAERISVEGRGLTRLV